MMRIAVLLLVAVGVALAAPQFNRNTFVQHPRNDVPILVDERSGPDEFGNFHFRYETGDGTSHQAHGSPVGDDSFFVQGSYSYTSPEGDLVEVRYTADENGFHAESPFLPTTPAPPPHALAQIKAAEEAFARQRSGQPQQRFQPQPQSFRSSPRFNRPGK